MNMTKDDNMTLGTLLLGIGVVIVAIWALKAILGILLNVAESVLVVGFYAVLIYIALALVLTIYAQMFPKSTPKLIKSALAVHHTIAISVKYFFRICTSMFRKKKSRS